MGRISTGSAKAVADDPSGATEAGDSPDRVAMRVGVAKVRTLDGEQVQLRSLWREHRTVNVFVRQFGCLFCHQMVHDVIDWLPDIAAREATLVLVGNGTEDEARRFFTAKGLPRSHATVVTDPERNTYQAADFQSGFGRTFLQGEARRAYVAARREGHRITGWFGDLTQLGGIVVVRPPAHGLFVHRSRFAGDHAAREDVLAALDA
jgi:hypothetical protein